MSAEILVDTNVLVYAYDHSEPQKGAKALDALDVLAVRGLGALSTQVLAEFFNAVTRKIPAPLSLEQAYDSLKNYLESWRVLDVSGMVVLEAARGARDHGFNFWDAQIWAVARLNQIGLIFSEDFNPGATIEGVRFVDPFAGDFDIEDWLA